MRAILDTSVLLADANARPDLTGIEGRVSSVTYGEMNVGVAVAKTAEGQRFPAGPDAANHRGVRVRGAVR